MIVLGPIPSYSLKSDDDGSRADVIERSPCRWAPSCCKEEVGPVADVAWAERVRSRFWTASLLPDFADPDEFGLLLPADFFPNGFNSPQPLPGLLDPPLDDDPP